MGRFALKEQIAEKLAEWRVTPGKSRFLAAVSGGPDSMVMLHLLLQLGFDLKAVHVNYRKRGADSKSDEELVRDYCDQLGMEVLVADGSAVSTASPGGNFQNRARQFRIALFSKEQKRSGAEGVFLGHHREDQIETLFQRMLRGAAPENWQGMKYREGIWIRPLLETSRNAIIEYALQYEVPYRIDQTNLESDFARNSLRNEVFPVLEQHFPGWRDSAGYLLDFADLHSELLQAILNGLTGTGTDAGEDSDFGDPDSVSSETRSVPEFLYRDRWLELSRKVRPAVMRYWIREKSGFMHWSRGMVERLNDLEHIATGKGVMLGDGINMMRDRNRFVIQQTRPFREDALDTDSVIRENAKETAEGHEELRVLLPDDLAENPAVFEGFRFEKGFYDHSLAPGVLQLALENLKSGFTVRKWKHGDRFQPLGMSGIQKVSDHLTNRKIPASQKKDSMVLLSFDQKVHAVIFPQPLEKNNPGTISEQVRCRKKGEPVLVIKKNHT